MDTHAAKAMTVVERSEMQVGDHGMSPVVSAGLAILERNPSPETLDKLLAVQERWEANEARKAFTVALVGLTADLPHTIARDKKVDFNTTHYTHTTLGAAVEAVKPHLQNHGFVHSWYPSSEEDGQVAVTCRITHRSGHFETVKLKAPPDPKGGKNGAQAVASTVTMLERYTLLALLGIATADMAETPSGEESAPPSSDTVDAAKNLLAVGWLKRQGRSVAQAEAVVFRKVEEWTAADREKLKDWARPKNTDEGQE